MEGEKNEENKKLWGFFFFLQIGYYWYLTLWCLVFTSIHWFSVKRSIIPGAIKKLTQL